MKLHRPNVLVMIACAAATLSGCGNSNSAAPAVSVTFTSGFLPPTAVTLSEQCGIAATVTNDPKNQGVNWSCTPTSQCGGFLPTSTPSTTPTTYTAPTSVPGGGTVIVTATSVTDPTKFISSSPITVGQTSSGCVAP